MGFPLALLEALEALYFPVSLCHPLGPTPYQAFIHFLNQQEDRILLRHMDSHKLHFLAFLVSIYLQVLQLV
jgi:hypothetical protein